VLSEQIDAWFYKPNLGEGQFGPMTRVLSRPSLAALNHGRQQILNLAGDSHLDLVEFGAPRPGFFSRTDDVGCDQSSNFPSLPNIEWQDPIHRERPIASDCRESEPSTGETACQHTALTMSRIF
jgi:hypothetical protein